MTANRCRALAFGALYALALPAALGAEQAAGDKPFKLYWKEGETVFEAENIKLVLSNRIQFRLTSQDPDDAFQLPGTASPGDSIRTFRIRRAKTQLQGWFWKPELSFELQLGWAGSDAAGGSATFSGLEDALLNWDASRDGALQLQVGQFKVPFGRQELTSSEKQQFVDRSILSGEFTFSRDVGAMVWGQTKGGRLEYRFGAFNGNGRNHVIDDNDKFQYDARVMFQPWGEVKYSESDFESKDRPLLAVAAGFQSRNQHNATNANDFNDTTWSGDVVFKYHGFSAYAEYFSREREPELGPAYHSDGFVVQSGVFLKRDVFELAFRYAWWDPSDRSRGDDQTEIGGAANYYLLKHRFKLQADYRVLEDDTQGLQTHELRAQVQFVF